MGKKKSKTKQKLPEKKNKNNLILWVSGAAVIAVLAFILLHEGEKIKADQEKGRSFYVQGGETRPTLDPSLFTGRVKAAYAAAKEVPHVLDEVYCYCFCDDPPFRHKSLLSCFVDDHGAA